MPRSSRSSFRNSSRDPDTTSVSYPRYTTFAPDELQAAFDRLSHIGNGGKDGNGNVQDGSLSVQHGSGSRLTKSHECPVSYPDGTSGLCRYTRGGPTWHVFQFEHNPPQRQSVNSEDKACRFVAVAPSYLPPQHCTERIANTLAVIEAKAAELAQSAFIAAIEKEGAERFKRASVPTGYNRYSNGRGNALANHLSSLPRPQMTTKRAKEMAGKYALCLCIGPDDDRRFVPCTGVDNQCIFDRLDEANAAWLASEHRARRFVACLCRYSRQWELPLYSLLHAKVQYAQMLGLIFQVSEAAEPADETDESIDGGTLDEDD